MEIKFFIYLLKHSKDLPIYFYGSQFKRGYVQTKFGKEHVLAAISGDTQNLPALEFVLWNIRMAIAGSSDEQ